MFQEGLLVFKEEQSSLKHQAGGSLHFCPFFWPGERGLRAEMQDICEEKVNTFLISESLLKSYIFWQALSLSQQAKKKKILLSGVRSIFNLFKWNLNPEPEQQLVCITFH